MDIYAPLIPAGGEGPIHYLAFVAYPDHVVRRDRFLRASARLAAKAAGTPPREHPEPFSSVPGTPTRWGEVFNAGMDEVARRRLTAGYIALNLLDPAGPNSIEAAHRQWLSLPWGKGGDERPRPYSPPANDAYNARGRIWRASLSALPMTLALMFEPETLQTLLERTRDGCTDKAAPAEVDIDGPLAMDRHQRIADRRWVPGAVAAARDLAAPLASPLLPSDGHVLIPRLGRC